MIFKIHGGRYALFFRKSVEEKLSATVVIFSDVDNYPYPPAALHQPSLMRCAALECAQYGIRVNTVNPGAVETRMMESIENGFAAAGAGDFKAMVEAVTPLGRYGQPDEIANMMVFLGSDDSSYCTGSVYMVDGGNAT